jgi:hypothetical protein
MWLTVVLPVPRNIVIKSTEVHKISLVLSQDARIFPAGIMVFGRDFGISGVGKSK